MRPVEVRLAVAERGHATQLLDAAIEAPLRPRGPLEVGLDDRAQPQQVAPLHDGRTAGDDVEGGLAVAVREEDRGQAEPGREEAGEKRGLLPTPGHDMPIVHGGANGQLTGGYGVIDAYLPTGSIYGTAPYLLGRTGTLVARFSF